MRVKQHNGSVIVITKTSLSQPLYDYIIELGTRLKQRLYNHS